MGATGVAGLAMMLLVCTGWSQSKEVVPADSMHIAMLSSGETDTATVSPLRVYNPLTLGLSSAIIPGAGQVYSRHYIKAGLFLGLEATLGSMAYFWNQSAINNHRDAEG